MASKYEVPGLTTQVKRHQSHQVWKKGLVWYCTLQVIARQRNRKHSARCIARRQRIESSRNNATAITTQHPKPAAVGNRGAPIVIAGPCRPLQGRQLVELHAACSAMHTVKSVSELQQSALQHSRITHLSS